jgi:hypothetical protein
MGSPAIPAIASTGGRRSASASSSPPARGRTLTTAPPPPPPPVQAAPSPAPGGLGWIRTPRWIGEACASLPRIAGHCPGVIPLAQTSGTIAEAAHDRRIGPGRVEDEVGVQWGGESAGHPARNHPPGFLHFEVSAGDIGGLRRFGHAATVPAAGIMRGRSFFTSAPVPFGSRLWGTHHGVLVRGDCWGNHLCYR